MLIFGGGLRKGFGGGLNNTLQQAQAINNPFTL